MKGKQTLILMPALAVGLLLMLFDGNRFLPFLVPFVFAHCDTEDGPVVTAAKKALETGNVNLVLIWVKKDDEAEIKKVFEKTLKVRKLSPEAKELADRYFFETLVRIHRAGEGESYTGIKPVGAEVEPGIVAADKAIENGSVDNLIKELSTQLINGVRERFNNVLEKKRHKDESVESGREYVKAYITFIHYVERLHLAVLGKGTHHGETEGLKPKGHHEH